MEALAIFVYLLIGLIVGIVLSVLLVRYSRSVFAQDAESQVVDAFFVFIILLTTIPFWPIIGVGSLCVAFIFFIIKVTDR